MFYFYLEQDKIIYTDKKIEGRNYILAEKIFTKKAARHRAKKLAKLNNAIEIEYLMEAK